MTTTLKAVGLAALVFAAITCTSDAGTLTVNSLNEQLTDANWSTLPADWMSHFGSTKVKDLTLLGSHDAGCIQGKTSSIMPQSWPVTQEKSLVEQMRAGYRVFDIRFKRHKFSKTWRIHHGGFYFQSLAEVGKEFSDFCTHHTGELVIIRLKVESRALRTAEQARQHIQCIKDLIKVIDAGPKKCVVVRPNDAGAFMDKTILELKATLGPQDQAGSPVVIMPYVKPKLYKKLFTKVAPTKKHPGPDPDAYVKSRIFNYDKNQEGKFSESLEIKKVLAGQIKRFLTWNKHEKPTFGWWMTTTSSPKAIAKDKLNPSKALKVLGKKGTAGAAPAAAAFGVPAAAAAAAVAPAVVPVVAVRAMDVQKRDLNKLSDTSGKYAYWIFDLVHHFNVKGWTIWTDWAGATQMYSDKTVAQCVIMLNILSNVEVLHAMKPQLDHVTQAVALRVLRAWVASKMKRDHALPWAKAPAKKAPANMLTQDTNDADRVVPEDMSGKNWTSSVIRPANRI
jgi:hypothetical protein